MHAGVSTCTPTTVHTSIRTLIFTRITNTRPCNKPHTQSTKQTQTLKQRFKGHRCRDLALIQLFYCEKKQLDSAQQYNLLNPFGFFHSWLPLFALSLVLALSVFSPCPLHPISLAKIIIEVWMEDDFPNCSVKEEAITFAKVIQQVQTDGLNNF